MAAGSTHKVLLTSPHPTGDAPDAADTTSGKIWLFDRTDRPVSSSATVTDDTGTTIALGAGALITEWSRVAVNTDHTVNGTAVGAYVTADLTANVGTAAIPSDHLLVDGRDGSYYVAAVTYTPATGRPRAVRFEFQVSALVDYETNSDTVTIAGDEVVLVEALTERTFATGDVDTLLNTLPVITTGAGVPATTPAKLGNIHIDTSTPNAYIATGTSGSGDWTLIT